MTRAGGDSRTLRITADRLRRGDALDILGPKALALDIDLRALRFLDHDLPRGPRRALCVRLGAGCPAYCLQLQRHRILPALDRFLRNSNRLKLLDLRRAVQGRLALKLRQLLRHHLIQPRHLLKPRARVRVVETRHLQRAREYAHLQPPLVEPQPLGGSAKHLPPSTSHLRFLLRQSRDRQQSSSRLCFLG